MWSSSDQRFALAMADIERLRELYHEFREEAEADETGKSHQVLNEFLERIREEFGVDLAE